MNIVRRYTHPHNNWPRYDVEAWSNLRAERTLVTFLTAQGAADYLERAFPGESFHWDTRDLAILDEEERKAVDRYEDAKHDAQMERWLEEES